MRHSGSKVLQTERLVLRPFAVADAEAMFGNWAGDGEVTKYLTWTPHESVETTRELLTVWEEESRKPETYHWAIVSRGELIGDIVLANVNENNGSGEVGYCLAKKAWGNGFMTEAFREVIRYSFEEVGFHRIEGKHAKENIRSGRVMEKCGLAYEGLLRQYQRLLSTGEWADIVVRGILVEDYFTQKETKRFTIFGK